MFYWRISIVRDDRLSFNKYGGSSVTYMCKQVENTLSVTLLDEPGPGSI